PEQRGDAREDAARLAQALLDLVEDGAEDHSLAFPLNPSSSPAEIVQQPTARLPGPWQSLPPVTASPRAPAQSRSWRARARLVSGYSTSTAPTPQDTSSTRASLVQS